MTEKQLSMFLKDFSGASFVSLVTQTTPKMRIEGAKGEINSNFGMVTRTAVRNGMIGAQYENVVNNRREKEGNSAPFESFSLWSGKGKHLSACLVEHTGTKKQYLVFYPRSDASGNAVVQEDAWTIDGKEVSKESVVPFLVTSRKSERQGVERTVAWRTIALESIVSMTVSGETFTITH